MVLRPSDPKPKWRVLGKTNNPAHVEVIDLDGDGIKDILVADLGNFIPTDDPCGRVVWLRGNKDRTFTPHVLLENVGRVADVQAADFRKTGKLDLVVAEFGLYKFGSILFLENQTTDWSKPKFVPKVIDGRHGAIHVPCRDARGKLVDLNGDGRIDFVALISQEHEAVVAFLNEGNGKFTKKTIYTAPHPAYGSSGIQLVDMNGDGKLDVLYTNGDSLDPPALLKPYHAVQWLENPGDGKYPWKHHLIGPMYGAMRAVAADVNGDGLVDVVAVSFLPKEWVAERKARDRDLDAIVLFEQTSPGKFVRHPLLMEECDHTSCALGDVMGSGRLDLVVGNFGFNVETPVTVWKNLGKPKPRK